MSGNAIVPVRPNIRCLGYTLSNGNVGRSGYTRPGTTLINPNASVKLEISSNFAMGCCGAAELSKFGNQKLTDNQKADFLVAFLPFVSDVTMYSLVSTDQINSRNFNNSGVLNLLREIGMKQVDERPNRIHGPNNMHLMVLDPQEINWEVVKKYLYGYLDYWIPNYVKDLSPEEQKALFDMWSAVNRKEEAKQREEAIEQKRLAKTKPLRDMFSLLYYGNEQLRGRRDVYSPEIMKDLVSTLNKHGWHHDSESNLSTSATVGSPQVAVGQNAGVFRIS